MSVKYPLFGCNGKFVLLAAHDRLGMQPGRADASPIKPKKLVSSSARALCKSVPPSLLLPSRIVTVAVKPDTCGCSATRTQLSCPDSSTEPTKR
jgi:hypothetical protein